MVTVIADKEDLRAPVDNGVNRKSNEHERPFQYVKDYQEVIRRLRSSQRGSSSFV